MTDQELKDLVAGIAAGHELIRAEQAETARVVRELTQGITDARGELGGMGTSLGETFAVDAQGMRAF